MKPTSVTPTRGSTVTTQPTGLASRPACARVSVSRWDLGRRSRLSGRLVSPPPPPRNGSCGIIRGVRPRVGPVLSSWATRDTGDVYTWSEAPAVLVAPK